MIFISKRPTEEAKKALREFIKNKGESAQFADFGQPDGKKEVQDSLAEEQFYICAYCMRRIHKTEKIEHWDSQASSKQTENLLETLDYDNMFAVCNGISVHQSKNYEHCDTSRSKSNKELTVNPTDKHTIDQIEYLANGTIYSKNPDIEDDLDNKKSLNLNNLVLLDNRKRTCEDVQKVIQILKKTSKVSASTKIRAYIQSFLKPKFNKKMDRYELAPFCGIILYRFKKYLEE